MPKEHKPIRYAIVGTGVRAIMFREAIAGAHAPRATLNAICDINKLRMLAWQQGLKNKIPMFQPDNFSSMLHSEGIERVIVTSIDASHHHYIRASMEAGCDVITEKPMTTDAEKCRQIHDAMQRTGCDLRVAFNYRYSPRNARIKELLKEGVIGRVLSVNFEWLLDTQHGADYFRRWHRNKDKSGGLLVHKATHHFDLMNWWLDSVPEIVYAQGSLKFYGDKNAAIRGVVEDGERNLNSSMSKNNPFAIDLRSSELFRALYLEPEKEDGYIRDQSVFSKGITIEDDLSAIIQYRNGVTMNYHLFAYAPWEGYRIGFNGEKGRLEVDVVERAFNKNSNIELDLGKNMTGQILEASSEPVTITIRPHWAPPVRVEFNSTNESGHGGGDSRMLAELFSRESLSNALGQSAGFNAGAYSVICGIAGNQSMATGQPIRVHSLLPYLS